MVTTPQSVKTTLKPKTNHRFNARNMSQDRSTSKVSAFHNNENMSVEEKNTANKAAKGVKKDMKNIARTSKEIMEEMLKSNQKNNNRMDDKIEHIGNKIARTVTGEVREGMDEMVNMLGGIMNQLVKQNESPPQEK